ncbi:hypothetical protein TgHK011_001655 [Trichoderma gracile]|nr:hypothetical protein TgHK011_001655 [Trichoderma gracile]
MRWAATPLIKVFDKLASINVRIQTAAPEAKVRVIFVDSAAKAIEDAITREVDIISLSQTVRNVANMSLGMPNGSGTGTHAQGKASSYEASVRALHRSNSTRPGTATSSCSAPRPTTSSSSAGTRSPSA